MNLRDILLGSIISVILGCFHVSAQEGDRFTAKEIEVEESSHVMSKGEQPCFKVDIPQIDAEHAKEVWEKLMKESAKAKVEEVGNELVVTDAVIKSISKQPVNVYALFLPYMDRMEWYTFFEMDSMFITKENHKLEYLQAKQFVRDFAIRAYKRAVELEIEKENDKLSELEKQLDKFQKEDEKLNSNIDKANRDITSAEHDISTVEMNMEMTRQELKKQKGETAKQSSTELIKASEKQEKKIEGDLNKLIKEKEKLLKSIDDNKAEIKEAENGIQQNQSSIDRQQQLVEDQKEVIAKLKQKMASIR